MASYRIEFKRSAEKELRRITSSEIPRILGVIRDLGEDPHPQGSKKLVGTVNAFRVRAGDYRVIYEIIETVKIVAIEKIRHRKDACRE